MLLYIIEIHKKKIDFNSKVHSHSQQKTWVWPLANTYTWGERKKKEREEKQLHTQISTSIDTYSNVDKPYIHTTQSETVIIEGDFNAKECF